MTVTIVAFAVFLVLHGLLHLLGTAKAFGWADLPQLTAPISAPAGLAWFASALLFVAAAMALWAWPRGWWAIGLAALVVSMTVIVSSWSDAKFGAAANVVVLLGVALGFLSLGPLSLRAQYDRDVEALVVPPLSVALVTDADLAQLPGPVQRYLRGVGVVGHPRVHDVLVRMHGRIRSGRDARWMPITAEQHNIVHPAARLFYLTASMAGVPVQGYHRYVGAAASMRVKAAGLVPVATGDGDEMTRSETVTLFNDMCLLAPATLIDPAIAWTEIDTGTVMARFTNAGHTITATLRFDADGALRDFTSDDRSQVLPDGTLRTFRWSTPVDRYARYGDFRLPAGGEARWHDADGGYAYIELAFDEVRYNVGPP